jgi:SAM-dependent methyltransferase
MFRGLGVRKSSTILDVGSGAGRRLHVLAAAGFRRLQGVDAYIDESRTYSNGVSVRKVDLSDVRESFDVVMFNHSFEHMDDPRGVLRHAMAAMNPKGWLLIRIPVADSWAFRHYGEHWAQLDAPRHLVVHTVAGMRELAREVGLRLKKVEYDSGAFGLWASERYLRGIPLVAEADYPTAADERQLAAAATRLNRARDGDQALFVLHRQGSSRRSAGAMG